MASTSARTAMSTSANRWASRSTKSSTASGATMVTTRADPPLGKELVVDRAQQP